MRHLRPQSPRALLRLYIIGSLGMLLLSLGLTALVLSSIFVQKEQHRSELALEQLGQAIEAQYRSIAEESWVGSYESIAIRVKDIARQHGDAKYYLVLANTEAKCLYAVGDGVEESLVCETPDELSRTAPRLSSSGTLKQILQFNEATNSYHYMAPLYVGTILKGYIYASFSDPYDFFRGNPIKLMLEFFVPALFTILILWFAWLHLSRLFILNPYLKQLVESEKREALTALASKVAHDIRSPLSAMNLFVSSLNEIPDDKRRLMTQASRRINEIANDLLANHRLTNQPAATSSLETRFAKVADLVQEICEEKQALYHSRRDLSIVIDLTRVRDLHETQHGVEISRVISNLIDNAAEAIDGAGSIRVRLISGARDCVLTITDDGKGIPADVLERLGHEPVSFGKTDGTSGNGLGVYNAARTLSAMGGRLTIQSREGEGTIVSLQIPNEVEGRQTKQKQAKFGGVL
jgi:signal transduction histidine kinase